MVQAINATKKDALKRVLNFGLAPYDREQRNVRAAVVEPVWREQPLDTGYDGLPCLITSERSLGANRRANGKMAVDVAAHCRSDAMVPRDPRKRAQRQQQSCRDISPSLTSAAAGPLPPRQRLVVGSLLPILLLGGKLAWPRVALLVDYTMGGGDRPSTDTATGKPDACQRPREPPSSGRFQAWLTGRDACSI